jgi:hypothetical protein
MYAALYAEYHAGAADGRPSGRLSDLIVDAPGLVAHARPRERARMSSAAGDGVEP